MSTMVLLKNSKANGRLLSRAVFLTKFRRRTERYLLKRIIQPACEAGGENASPGDGEAEPGVTG
jgi:hypothetical protein